MAKPPRRGKAAVKTLIGYFCVFTKVTRRTMDGFENRHGWRAALEDRPLKTATQVERSE